MRNHKSFIILLGMIFLLSLFQLSADEQVRFQGKYIYSDGSELYRSPSRPEPGEPVVIRIRVRTGMAENVTLHYGEGESLPMVSLEREGFYETFACRLPGTEDNFSYYFSLAQGDKKVYYSRRGMEVKKPPRAVQFLIQPNFTVPQWMEGAVLYQIFVDRFHNGNPANDVVTNEYLYDNYPAVALEWNELPDSATTYPDGSDRTREFYGGDIQGIMDKLDYLADLGVEGIYLNPVFVSPSNHKYDTQDYYHIDPHFGLIVEDDPQLIDPREDPSFASDDFNNASEVNGKAGKYITRTTAEVNLEASDELFRQFIEEAHSRGIKVILDGVFNHSGSFNRWFDREHLYESNGAYESADSLWSEYYQFDESAWPDNESYVGWYGYKTLPKLNLESSPELEREILEVAARWVGPEFGADGWRLDVAAELGNTPGYNHEFWQKFRDTVKAANPDAVILAEVYGDSSSWLQGEEWDTIMNYDAFFDPVSHFLTGLEKHSWYEVPDQYNNTDHFIGTLLDKMARMPWESLNIAMNELSNHDHSRFYSRTGGYADVSKHTRDVSDPEKADDNLNRGIMKEAVMLQMFMPGAPTIYYGEEAGLPGFTDPDCRRPYPWGNEDQELLSFYRNIIELRGDFSCLKGGSFLSLPTERQGVYAFTRWNDRDAALVVINNREEDAELTLNLELTEWDKGDVLVRKLLTGKEDFNRDEESFRLKGKSLTLSLPAYGGAVYYSSVEWENREIDKPEVLSFSRPRGEVAGSVTIEFDRPMNQRQIMDAFSMVPERKGRFFWNGNSVTFVPSTAVFPGDYQVHITDKITSREGNFPLNEETSWSFRVK